MLFLLIEVKRFPERIRGGFSPERARRLMGIVDSMTRRMNEYIRVKVVASLCLALPQAFILWAGGVKFPVMWGLLAFIGNFIPYIGSLVALVLPVVLTLLDVEPVTRALLVVGCLLVNQFVNNNLVEPFLTARAVGLSPLVVLIALSFWGLCWGLIGMLLAVPLTVMLKIVLENVPITKPLARLMSER
jgi:AI-2 transport protein TqsA